MNKIYFAYKSAFVDMNVIGFFTKKKKAIKEMENEINNDAETNKQYELPYLYSYYVDELVDDDSGKLVFSKSIFSKEN
jgi:hypothetical protein